MPNSRTSAVKGLKLAAPRALYFAIFAISGFSGLIYESIWSHYLKLFLGHAAYAQSLVLIIFMGGMAIGSQLASRFSAKMRIPILAYALVEAIVGVMALLFHNVFSGLIEAFHATILPSMGAPTLGITLKWLAACLLILPQSILLGMTFPLMSAGILRRFPDTPGGSIAMLYFTNSIGAAIGVLVSGFVMIRAFGLPGAIMTAGLLNIALALTVWTLVRLDPQAQTESLPTPADARATTLTRLFLVAAFITGMASFIYEIAWIRMLSLVLGATTHSFELMLSAFITGLAFGGLWIKQRIDRVHEPIRFSGYVQLIMGALALLTIPVYVMSFEWMTWIRSALQPSAAGFAGYSIVSHAIALAVMLPTTFMAGMTLPLFTYVLLRKGSGESSIGRIYAANTLGAIVGVLFAVHIGLPVLGLKNLIVFGAALDIALGSVLIVKFTGIPWRSPGFVLVAIAVVAIAGLGVFGQTFDQRLLASGVYRYKNTSATANDEFLFYKDGKTASVAFRISSGGLGVLATNGKVDASIQLNPEEAPSPDESTMILAGVLPMAYAPDATHAANIGMGSGQTAHTILGNPRIEVVDTVEIEVEMVNASRHYGEQVARVYDDPRSRIHIEDAKTYFSLNNTVYDFIIAEPSNPWVSGVSSLFSKEFYATVRNYLEDEGIFVQWIQAYEFTDELAVSILKALAIHFADFDIYTSSGMDIILVARKSGELGEPHWESVFSGELGQSLARAGIHSPADLHVRQLASRDLLAPYLQDAPAPTNSDYFPYVDLNAGKALYLNSNALMFLGWSMAPLPMLEMLNQPDIAFDEVSLSKTSARVESILTARWIHEKLTRTKGSEPTLEGVNVASAMRYIVDWLAASQQTCAAQVNPERFAQSTFDVMVAVLPNAGVEAGLRVLDEVTKAACALASEEQTAAWLRLYAAVARRDGRDMFKASEYLLHRGDDLPFYEREYLLNAAMLGALASDRHKEAFDIWNAFGKDYYADRPMPSYTKLVLSAAARFEDDNAPQAATQ